MAQVLPEHNSDSRLFDMSKEVKKEDYPFELWLEDNDGEWGICLADPDKETLEQEGDLQLMSGKYKNWVVKNHRQEILSTANSKRSGSSPAAWGLPSFPKHKEDEQDKEL